MKRRIRQSPLPMAVMRVHMSALILLILSLLRPVAGFPPAAWSIGPLPQQLNFSSVTRGANSHTRFTHHFRGGAVLSDRPDQNPDEDDALSREERFRHRGMSLALASSYFAVMGAKCALPSVLSLLTSSKHGLTFSSTPQSQMANLLGLSTVAVAMGKLLLGPAIDYAGGIQSLQVCLSFLACLMALISSLQQFHHFALAWIFVDFIFSACWAASINSIHQSFEEKDWGKQIGYLAMGARTGNAAAFSIFATILYILGEKTRQPWREVFVASAILQLIPLALISYFGRGTLQKATLISVGKTRTPQPTTNSFRILLHEARSAPEFWLHLLSRSCLMIFASFLLFVPTLMSQVYGTSMSVAAQVASVYSLGCLVSVSLGSRIYSSLPKTKQMLAIIVLLGVATICSLVQLAHVSGLMAISPAVAALSMFAWGFSFSIPFYLPPSLYALERGGGGASATISDGFDFLGFALLAMFNSYVASIVHSDKTAWIGCFQITTLCSLVSLIAQPLAVFFQYHMQH
jgi:sugar phosphate permease